VKPASSVSPGEIVAAYLAAQSRGDAEGALDILSEDAVREAASPDTRSAPNPCVGKSTIGTNFLRRAVRGHPN
jgi:ketosteroid isomerase-like protein